MKLHEKIRKLLDEQGLTDTALAEKTGIPRSTIADFLSGKTAALTRLDRICKALGVEIILLTNANKEAIIQQELDLQAVEEKYVALLSDFLKLVMEITLSKQVDLNRVTCESGGLQTGETILEKPVTGKEFEFNSNQSKEIREKFFNQFGFRKS